MKHVKEQIQALPMPSLVSLHNKVFGDEEQYKIRLLSAHNIDGIFKTPLKAFLALEKLGTNVSLEQGDYIRYEATSNSIEVVTRADIIDTCLTELAEFVVEQGVEFASQFGITIRQERWQAYDASYYLSMNIEKLSEAQVRDIITQYFDSEDVKVSEEYSGIVMVKELAELEL